MMKIQKDGDTEKKITTFTMNLRGAETQGYLASIAVGFSAWSAVFAGRLSLTLAFRCCYSSFGWPQDEIGCEVLECSFEASSQKCSNQAGSKLPIMM